VTKEHTKINSETDDETFSRIFEKERAGLIFRLVRFDSRKRAESERAVQDLLEPWALHRFVKQGEPELL
jgi:hypothetical protein